MCSLKTLASAAVCNLAALGAPAFAGQSLDLAREFANCTGRYSALMEHEWLMGTTGAGAAGLGWGTAFTSGALGLTTWGSAAGAAAAPAAK